jgi:hypothetical protein
LGRIEEDKNTLLLLFSLIRGNPLKSSRADARREACIKKNLQPPASLDLRRIEEDKNTLLLLFSLIRGNPLKSSRADARREACTEKNL